MKYTQKIILLLIAMVAVVTSAHADNFTFSQGSGKTGASDTISGVEYSRYKLIIGADGVNDGDISAANPLPVTGIVSSMVPGTGATNLGKAEDSVHTTADVGVMFLAVSNAAGTSLAADGDYVPFTTDQRGRSILSGVANGGLVIAEDTAHTSTDPGIVSLALINEARTALSATDLDYGIHATDRFGQAMPQIQTPFAVNGLNDLAESGSTTTNIVATAHSVQKGDTVWFGSASGSRAGLGYVTDTTVNAFTITPPLRVAPSNGDFFYIQSSARPSIDSTSGNLIVNISDENGNRVAKREDVAHTTGDPGFMVWTVRTDAAASSAGATGDNAAFTSGALGQLHVQDIGGTANGGTIHRVISANSNNATNVKNAAGNLYGGKVCAGTAAAGFLKLFNKASTPTCGTDVPVAVVPLPATIGACQSLDDIASNIGASFSLGIGYCMVTGVADNDNTAVALNQMLLTLNYK